MSLCWGESEFDVLVKENVSWNWSSPDAVRSLGVDVRSRHQKWTSSAASSKWPIRWPRRGSSSQRSWEKGGTLQGQQCGSKGAHKTPKSTSHKFLLKLSRSWNQTPCCNFDSEKCWPSVIVRFVKVGQKLRCVQKCKTSSDNVLQFFYLDRR